MGWPNLPSRDVSETRGRSATEPLVCHGRTLTLVAESPAGRRLIEGSPSQSHWDYGIALARWRCVVCGAEHYEGWVPPVWINAVSRKAREIRLELEAALTLVEAGESHQRARSGPQRAAEPLSGCAAASEAPVTFLAGLGGGGAR